MSISERASAASSGYRCCSVPLETLLRALSGNLEEDGYVVISPVISEAECDHYSFLADMLDGNNNRSLLDRPWCRALSDKIQHRLNSIIPKIESYTPVQCTFFRKNEKNNWLVATHQDKSLPYESEYDGKYSKDVRVKDGLSLFQPPQDILKKVIAIRLSLDVSHKNNGPLRLLAGTHKKGILDSGEIDDERATTDEVVPEIERGGVLCIRPLILHASSKSTSSDQRRVLHFVYRSFN